MNSSKRFTQYPISKVQGFTKAERYRIQKGTHRYVITSCGEIAGFLLPISELGTLNPIRKYTEFTLTEFRHSVGSVWSLLLSGFDCVYITFHNRRIMAFVSPKLFTKEELHGLSIQNPA